MRDRGPAWYFPSSIIPALHTQFFLSHTSISTSAICVCKKTMPEHEKNSFKIECKYPKYIDFNFSRKFISNIDNMSEYTGVRLPERFQKVENFILFGCFVRKAKEEDFYEAINSSTEWDL